MSPLRSPTIEDILESVIPVCTLWCTTGWFALQSYQKLEQINVEATLFDIFQSAQLLRNMRTWKRFGNQKEYTDYMRAGMKLCDICMRNGCKNLLHNVFVDEDVLKTVKVHQDRNHRAFLYDYSLNELEFIKAGFEQLLQLDLEHHSAHIKRIGQAMRHCPGTVFDNNWAVDDWTRPLREEKLFCKNFENAIEDLYGVDWFWERLPGERSKGPTHLEGAMPPPMTAMKTISDMNDPLFEHPRKLSSTE